MRLNKQTNYAIHILLLLSETDGKESFSSQEISSRVSLGREITLKILRKLRSDGLIVSTRGRDGGFVLSRPLDQITVWDVLESMEFSTDITNRLDHERESGCEVLDEVRQFYDHLQTVIRQCCMISLQDILDQKMPHSPAIHTVGGTESVKKTVEHANVVEMPIRTMQQEPETCGREEEMRAGRRSLTRSRF